MFKDETTIEVIAGKGGDGLVSFRREKYVPRGGPDGGDGGKGGDIILVADHHLNSLLTISGRPRYEAQGGKQGGTKNCYGKSGDDLVLHVPVGTMIFDARRGNLLRDLVDDGQRLIVAAGGKGGKGNARFATSIQQAPRKATFGIEGEHRELRLELKLFADVGLVGLPNAGKSSFLSVVTAATPKVANYPFTTLVPQVGIAAVGDRDSLCIADLPGLIEGAAEGHGLGHQFLKHVERCRVLLHFVDVSEQALDDPHEAYAMIDRELARFSTELADKERLVVATKVEDDASEARAAELEATLGKAVFRLSSLQRRGLHQLLGSSLRLVQGLPQAP